MLKIRLSRTGKKHQPHYRIVVTPVRSKRDGEVTDRIGHWHPKEDRLVLDKKAYLDWISKGAIPTPTVRKLINQ